MSEFGTERDFTKELLELLTTKHVLEQLARVGEDVIALFKHHLQKMFLEPFFLMHAPARLPYLAVLVVAFPLLGVGQHLIRDRNRFELEGIID